MTKPFTRITPATKSGKPRIYRLAPPLVTETVDLVSVTSLLNALPKPALKYWGERLVAEAAADNIELLAKMERDEMVDWLKDAPYRKMTRAGKRGTDIHLIAEGVLDGTIAPGTNPYAHAILRFADEWIDQIISLEQTIVHLDDGWAGTTDIIYKNHQGDIVLGDWKTSASGVYPDWAFQLGAYAHGQHWVMNVDTDTPSFARPMEIDRLAILHITEDGVAYHEPSTTIDELYQIFLAVATVWRAENGPDKVRMDPISKPPRPTVTEYVENLKARCLHAQSENVAFRATVKALWPKDVPTLNSGKIVRLRQCELIDHAVTDAERALDITFGAVPNLGYHPSLVGH